MKLLVGLGNPEAKFNLTRHNVGYQFLDYCKNRLRHSNWVLRKTDVFMNESGIFVRKFIERFGLESANLYIVHDDLDIKFGEYKIQFAKGPKDNGGINSIESELGTKDFWRIRIGIDNRESENRVDGIDYVLSDFTINEQAALKNVFEKICKELVNT